MSDLTLTPMSQEFYDTWMSRLEAGYAQDHVEAGDWSADEALAKSQAETAKLLPDGLNSANHLLFTAHDAAGETVGLLWIGLDRPDNGAWIYDIEVLEGHRGSGNGRALLNAAEEATREAGAATLGLNVFGPNATARALYESSGFEITSMQMRKPL